MGVGPRAGEGKDLWVRPEASRTRRKSKSRRTQRVRSPSGGLGKRRRGRENDIGLLEKDGKKRVVRVEDSRNARIHPCEGGLTRRGVGRRGLRLTQKKL